MRSAELFWGALRVKFRLSKIHKNIPYGFDKSADLLIKCQNHVEDFFKLCVFLKKSELYMMNYSPKDESCQDPNVYSKAFKKVSR